MAAQLYKVREYAEIKQTPPDARILAWGGGCVSCKETFDDDLLSLSFNSYVELQYLTVYFFLTICCRQFFHLLCGMPECKIPF